MYEEERALNEKLKKEAKELQRNLADSKAELERLKCSAAVSSSSPSCLLDTSATERRMTFTVLMRMRFQFLVNI